MKLKVELDKIILVEKSKKDFDKELKKQKVLISHFTNTDRLDYLRFKYLLIKQSGKSLGYVILAETFNKFNNVKSWNLLNIEIETKYRECGIGSVALGKIHQILSTELSVKSYIVALNSYVMYKMLVRENLKGKVDFYCLINTQYPIEEMKEEEKDLEQVFLQRPDTHADMIVSFDQKETERVKPLYFKVE